MSEATLAAQLPFLFGVPLALGHAPHSRLGPPGVQYPPPPPRSLAVWSDPGLGAGWACAAVLHVTFLAPAEKLRFQSTLIDSPS